MTPFTAFRNQFQPQEVAIYELEAELDINHSPSDITSTPSDREPHLGLSSGGNLNKERTIEIAEISLIHHQEEAAEDNNNSANDANENASDSDEEDSINGAEESEEEEESDSLEILFEVDKESEDSDDKEESEDSMSSSLNHQGTGTGGRERSGRSVRTSTPAPNQPLTYTLNGITVSFSSPIPPTNVIHNVGVVYPRMSRPAYGSDAERKMVEAISKKLILEVQRK